MSEEHTPRSRTESRRPAPWRLIIAVILLAVIVVFVLENNHKVNIRFVGPTVHASLALALLVSALLGALMGFSIQRHRRRR